jgi:hypothetical protein
MRFIALLVAGCVTFPAQADDLVMADKSSVQAAFLYNFALFTEWPSLPENAFSFCVLVDDHLLEALASLKSKQMKDRPILVRRIESSNQARSCQILFIGPAAHQSMKDIAAQIGADPVLLVSDEDTAAMSEVIILMREQQNRISFKINRAEASKRSMTFSSKLLRLATQVY